MWVACELRDLIDGGDHLIATGTVLEAESREAMPLIFHRGAYRDLLSEGPPAGSASERPRSGRD